MTETEYLRVLDEIGIDTSYQYPNCGHILKSRDGRKYDGVYFNRNRFGVIHFTLNPNAALRPDSKLWDYLPDREIKLVDKGKPNIVPKPGKERAALQLLLARGAQ